MAKYIRIKADTNDADYVEETSFLLPEQESLMRRWAKALKTGDQMAKWGHNWPSSGHSDESLYDLYEGAFTEEEIDCISDYVPYGEYGVHTVKEVEIFEKLNEEKLY